jgi:hypothetical protein
MQIILNSCFHYIIPRPDGTEENGDVFRELFAQEIMSKTTSTGSVDLLDLLPPPWRDMQVIRDEVLHASSTADDVSVGNTTRKDHVKFGTPSHSPRLDASAHEVQSPRDVHHGEGGDGGADGKRAVLLCFNENVRSAEDVFRCHNEFIRDTAHASNLQLSSNEWILFFGAEAASAPHLWGNVGIPVPYTEGQGPTKVDALGVFSSDQLASFRTSWCSKRYDHSHELCGFAHPEVNNGWIRRSPTMHRYCDEMCQFISVVETKRSVSAGSNIKSSLIIHECPHGTDCKYAHSVEEIMYHPNRYKVFQMCPHSGSAGGCALGDICPNFHPVDSYRFPKKSDSRSPRHSRQQQQVQGGPIAKTSPSSCPSGTPILYCSPAPLSNFEHHLQMPGLQSLFRRQCSVVRSHVRNNSTCLYSSFSDDSGTDSSNRKAKLFVIPSKVIHQQLKV